MKVKTVCDENNRSELVTVTTHEHVLLDLMAFYRELPVPGIETPATQKLECGIWEL